MADTFALSANLYKFCFKPGKTATEMHKTTAVQIIFIKLLYKMLVQAFGYDALSQTQIITGLNILKLTEHLLMMSASIYIIWDNNLLAFH